jgi:hypothetical protein
MKFAADRPYADPEAAARKLVEIAKFHRGGAARMFYELIMVRSKNRTAIPEEALSSGLLRHD